MRLTFGDKAKLVNAVQALATEDLWLSRVNEVKGLARVSNSKLLRLHDTLSRVKKDFGTRGKLIESILTLGKRQKDTGLKTRLEGLPTPRLVDLQTSAARRAKAGDKKKAAAPKAAAKKKKARSKKAKAKALEGAPTKKTAAKKKKA